MAAHLLGTDIACINTVCSDQTGSTPYKVRVCTQHNLYSVLLQQIIHHLLQSELIHGVSTNHNSESLLLYNSVTLTLKVDTGFGDSMLTLTVLIWFWSWRWHVDTGHINVTLIWRQHVDTDPVTVTLKWRQHVDSGLVTLTVELEGTYWHWSSYFDPEVVDGTFLWNIFVLLLKYMMPDPKTLDCVYTFVINRLGSRDARNMGIWTLLPDLTLNKFVDL